MAPTRLSLILLLGLSNYVFAGTISPGTRIVCATGQVTSNARCCALFPVIERMQADLFEGGDCGEDAHSALRLSFHDAIGFSIHGGKGGGADGSILAFNKTETAFAANGGIDDIIDRQYPVFLQSGLSAGDFVQLAAAVGTANCRGAPRLEFKLGRPAPVAPAPDLTVPQPTDSVTTILDRSADAGFNPSEVVALLASHTIAAADVLNIAFPGTPFDSTVDTFDSQVFLEVLLKGKLFSGNGQQPGEAASPIAGEVRLQSDFLIARDQRTACYWQAMVDNQKMMVHSFKVAMAKLQLLGQDEHNLIDCSDVIPMPAEFNQAIRFPPTFTRDDLEIACHDLAFPNLETAPGPAATVAPVV